MLYIEDIIDLVVTKLNQLKLSGIEYPDQNFLQSIYTQMTSKRGLTTRQAFAVKSILKKNADLIRPFIPNFDHIIHNNQWRDELRTVVEKRSEARYLGDNMLAFSFTPKEEISRDFAYFKGSFRDGLNLIPVTSRNYAKVINFIGKYNFEIDEITEEFLVLCDNSENMETEIVRNGNDIICNVCNNDALACYLLDIVGAERV